MPTQIQLMLKCLNITTKPSHHIRYITLTIFSSESIPPETFAGATVSITKAKLFNKHSSFLLGMFDLCQLFQQAENDGELMAQPSLPNSNPAGEACITSANFLKKKKQRGTPTRSKSRCCQALNSARSMTCSGVEPFKLGLFRTKLRRIFSDKSIFALRREET